MVDQKKVKVIKADKKLQEKVGTGPLDERVVERCQQVMDSNDVDFTPLATEYLQKLEDAIKEARENPGEKGMVQRMTDPVMQLKANAATFRYTLVSNMANVMLSFLEAVNEIDKDVIQIVDAHHKTLKIIVVKKMQGDGGAYGTQMEDELKAACKRYFTSKQKKS